MSDEIDIRMGFESRDHLLESLCKRVFGATPMYAEQLVQHHHHPPMVDPIIGILEDLERKLAAEKALADRLGEALIAAERWVDQPCGVKAEIEKSITAWKEARK